MQEDSTATEPVVTIDANQRICINGRIATSEQIGLLTEGQLSSLSFATSFAPSTPTETPAHTADGTDKAQVPVPKTIRNRKALFGFRTLMVATTCHSLWLGISGMVSYVSHHLASTIGNEAQRNESFLAMAITPMLLGSMFLVAPTAILRSQSDSSRAVVVLRLATTLAVFDAFLNLWHLIKTAVTSSGGLLVALASAVIFMALMSLAGRAAWLLHQAAEIEVKRTNIAAPVALDQVKV